MRTRVDTAADIINFNRDPAARGTGKTPGLSHIAVKNVDWGLPVCGPRAPPSDEDTRNSAIWRVERPWGPSGA